MQTAYITHQDCQAHDMGPQHPECPSRLRAIDQRFVESGLISQLLALQAQPASREHLLRAHPQAHVDAIHTMSPGSGLAFVDPDTAMNPHSLNAALLAAGASTQAVNGIVEGEFDRAFCAVRPPGHHAERDQAMGFCLFNNIAVAVLHALSLEGIERVAVIDFDVHHGNGTVDIFRDDPRVMVCSSFQYPFYPGRHQNIDRPHILNTPLPAGTTGLQFRKAVEQQWLAPLQQFKPQLLFVSAGFDAHRDDPLAQLQLLDSDYRWLGEFITSIANSCCAGRVIAVLEGGYNLEALASASGEFVSALVEN